MSNRLKELKRLIDEQRQILLVLGSTQRKDSLTSRLVVEKSQELDELIMEYLQLKGNEKTGHSR
ncbi:MAG TPA: aspartyl-phosphate phosphatase Spo0E family protein [Georgenia sp.]|nr:aspartyl-phosphate phosphatase Spo0E family protein [Georgenia sp.]